jgi:hypothetical protein
MCSDRRPDHETASELGTKPETVLRWRIRFTASGIDGLREPPGGGRRRRPLPYALTRDAVFLLMEEPPPPDEGGWTTKSLARALAFSEPSVQRVLRSEEW